MVPCKKGLVFPKTCYVLAQMSWLIFPITLCLKLFLSWNPLRNTYHALIDNGFNWHVFILIFLKFLNYVIFSVFNYLHLLIEQKECVTLKMS